MEVIFATAMVLFDVSKVAVGCVGHWKWKLVVLLDEQPLPCGILNAAQKVFVQ